MINEFGCRMPMKIALALLSALTICDPATAARLTPQDRAWIGTCIAARKDDHLAGHREPRRTAGQLRKYCTCMQAIVESNQRFTISELEHSYPPAHLNCQRESR